MGPSARLSPSEAAQRLGVSIKALRLYERHGLIAPTRTLAGWRVYGTDEMMRASKIVALRALGLSLVQIRRVLDGNVDDSESTLATHQAMLEDRIRDLASAVASVRELRSGLLQDKVPGTEERIGLMRPSPETLVAFDLPWPWGGERFELRDIRALNYIVGPLGSGKTRLAQRLAETLPNAVFLGLDRAASSRTLNADPALKSRVDQTRGLLIEDGGIATDALMALIIGLESEGPTVLVVDMVEQGLDQATQEALIAHLRRRKPGSRPLFLLTRSSAILDLAAVGPGEAVILCPANHSPPIRIVSCPGAPGYEAVATCLASPEVRARTEGVIAWRPPLGLSA